MTAAVRVLATAVLTAAMLVCLAAPASANHTVQDLVSPAGGAAYDWDPIYMSPDGERTIFRTFEPLDPADTDSFVDLYEAVGGTFSLLTPGTLQGGPSGFGDAAFSLDGSHVFFESTDRLVPQDRDLTRDIYETVAGVTRLVSVGDLPSNGLFDARLRDVSEDGTRAYFTTEEKLVAEDTDGGYFDVYERSPAGTRLVSTGPGGGGGEFDADFDGASGIGSVVVFSTLEQLVAGDTDNIEDLYANSNGATELVTTGPAASGGGVLPSLSALSRSGDRVVFSTTEALVAEDGDGSGRDIYARAGGTTTLVSTGPTATNAAETPLVVAASEDATRVFFRTAEHLTADHTWTGQGFYRRAGTTTQLVIPVSIPNAGNVFPIISSADGSRLFYGTHAKVLANDVDTTRDVYEWHEGVTTRMSTGPRDLEWVQHFLDGVSSDGERVFFSTTGMLVPEDTSADIDLYERYQGQTYLVTGTGGLNGFGTGVAGLSPDGALALVETGQALDPADTDGTRIDAYLYAAPAPSMSFSQFGPPGNLGAAW